MVNTGANTCHNVQVDQKVVRKNYGKDSNYYNNKSSYYTK